METFAAYIIAFIIFFSFLAIFVAIANKVLPPIDSKKREEFSKEGNYFWFKGRRYRREGRNRKKKIIKNEDKKELDSKGFYSYKNSELKHTKEINYEKEQNPDINLSQPTEVKLHFKRLNKFGMSKWKGEMYYRGKRGGIYTISANGTRNYKY